MLSVVHGLLFKVRINPTTRINALRTNHVIHTFGTAQADGSAQLLRRAGSALEFRCLQSVSKPEASRSRAATCTTR
jgi:hypothetical protein